MRRVPVWPALLALALSAPAAHAEGVNLRWTKCYGDGGVLNKSFACNTNTGVHILVASFVLDTPLPQVTGTQGLIDVTTAAPSLPSWWQFRNAGSCRQNSLLFNVIADANNIICVDWAAGQAVGGIGAYNVGTLGPNTAQINAVTAVPQTAAADLETATEYFSFNIVINNQKTAGLSKCAGCDVPACLAMSTFKIMYGGSSNLTLTLTQPAAGGNSNYVSWQTGTGIVPFANGTCAGFDTAGF